MTVALQPTRRDETQTRTHSVLHRALTRLPITAFLVDAAVISITAALAVVGRNRLGVFATDDYLTDTLGFVGPLMFVIWLGTIAATGGYDHVVFGVGTDEYKRVFNASLYTAAAAGCGCYLAKFQLSRGFFLLAVGIGIPLLLAGRLVLRSMLQQAHRAGHLQRRVVIAGRPAHVDEVASVLRRESWLGYQVIGAVTPAGHASASTAGGTVVLGDTDDLARLVTDAAADAVFFAAGAFRTSDEVRRVAWDLEQHHVQVMIAPSMTDVARERVTVRPVGGLPLMHVERARAVTANRWAKRSFDIIASGLIIALVSPLLLITALAIKLRDGGPVLFTQTRVGQDGTEFSCLKFRTMVPGAEAMLTQLQEDQGVTPLMFKMRDDPRITKTGRLLRRYSIDELPQLFNVFSGTMSLVGPRPQVPAEVALYDDTMSRRLRVRPGITGLWQVSGRSELSVEEAFRLDVYYVDNWSMLQDLGILARTVGAVLSYRGAY